MVKLRGLDLDFGPALEGGSDRAEDGAGAAAIATAQEGLSEEEIAAGRAVLELVQASELGDEVKAHVANLGSRLLDQQEANAELAGVISGSGSSPRCGSSISVPSTRPHRRSLVPELHRTGHGSGRATNRKSQSAVLSTTALMETTDGLVMTWERLT
eukprot:SAG11_NODE_1830_length_4192_cov_7.908403_4_plen_157_part_00